MKKVFVEDIREREWVVSPFLVREKNIGQAKNGRSYMSLKLMDRTGEVEGRVWDRVDELAELFSRDDFIQVEGKASVYLGRMQLVVQKLTRVEESTVNLADFLPVSKRSKEEMVGELKSLIDGLLDPSLKALMSSFIADKEFMESFTRAPAAKSMHHACLGGLLEHSLAVAALAKDVGEKYPDVNVDLLIVGALLHDVGKVTELRYNRSFEYTDEGKLLGHIMLGVELLDSKVRAIDEFPGKLAVHLKHLLLSHHGQYDYGSPKRPKTIEAVILNYLDDLDSKINGIKKHIAGEPDSDSSWTQYHKQYDRYFFKGFSDEWLKRLELDNKKPLSDSAASLKTGKHSSKFTNTLGDQLKAKKIEITEEKTQENIDE